MTTFDDDAVLAQLLPGRWIVKATNFPMWLTGERREPRFEYGLMRERPLTLSDRVAYVDASGKPKSIRGVDHWNGVGFTWKMQGIAGLFVRSRWEVAGVRQGLVVIRFEKSAVTPAGLDVVVAEGLDATELRSVIAADPASFGLSIEEFASLTWLDHLPPLE
ncbi:hypothetical protein BH09ACT4_BH09ACT4_13150 [soil metagenome]